MHFVANVGMCSIRVEIVFAFETKEVKSIFGVVKLGDTAIRGANILTSILGCVFVDSVSHVIASG